MLGVVIYTNGNIGHREFDTIPEAIAYWEALVNEGISATLSYLEV